LEKLAVNKIVIFDLDGTLINSNEQISEAVKLTRDELNFPQPNTLFINSKIGLPASELFSDLKLKASDETFVVEKFRLILKSISLEPRNSFTGSGKLLELLKSKGMRLAVATNKPSDLARNALEETELSKFIDVVVGGEKLRPKPHPAIVLKCIEELKSRPALAVMFGDRCEDMIAANEAKVPCYGLLQGIHGSEDLKKAGAKGVFKNISELLKSIQDGWNFENL
jgi:phosphoglycolate phosphatase